MKVILASKSPRRKELMDLAGFDYEILVSDVDETVTEDISLEEKSKEIAFRKAKKIFDNTQGDRIIIGADTLVIKNNEALGKPKTRQEAISMLKKIQGTSHKIYTSLVVLIENAGEYKEYKELFQVEVFVKEMSNQEIENYVDTNYDSVFDKAGSYSIQGRFSIFIQKIIGDFPTAIGLPIQRIYDILKENDSL